MRDHPGTDVHVANLASYGGLTDVAKLRKRRAAHVTWRQAGLIGQRRPLREDVLN
jgi:hypothetical protein